MPYKNVILEATAGSLPSTPDDPIAGEKFNSIAFVEDDLGKMYIWRNNRWISKEPPSPSSILTLVFPVGACFFTVTAGNPATILGFGTWERIPGGGSINQWKRVS